MDGACGTVAGSAVAGVLVLEVLMGLFVALVQMANTRLAMAVIPVMGRNHFFALYSVLGSVCWGSRRLAGGC